MQVHKQLAVVSSWHTSAVAHEHPITAFASSPGGREKSRGAHDGHGSGGNPALVASCDASGQLLVWGGPHLEPLAAVPAASVGASPALAWLPLEDPGRGVRPSSAEEARQQQAQQQQVQQQQQAQQQQRWLAVGSGSLLQCYAVAGRKAVAVCTAALPAGCSSILSLHVLEGGEASTSCLLLALCTSSAGRGSVACAWRCIVLPGLAGPAGPAGSLQLDLAGTAQVPGAAAVTAAVAVGSQQLVLGMDDGTVVLAALTAGSLGVQLQQSARLVEQARVVAVAADEHCLHIAAAALTGVSVWRAAADGSSGGADAAWQYSRAAHVALPPGCGAVGVIAWLHQATAPCLAVASNCSSILLLSSVRAAAGAGSWQWVAALPAAMGGTPASTVHLAAGSGEGSVVAAAGSQLLRLSEEVLVPPSSCGGAQSGSIAKLLGR